MESCYNAPMLYFVTENQDKIKDANLVLQEYQFSLEGKGMSLLKIQSDSQNEIILHKAKYAFDQLHHPLVVKDDAWYFSALRGFPGAYMKYVNEWFTAEDFLNLLKPYPNKEIIFSEHICYIDEKRVKVFSRNVKGTVLTESQGKGKPSMTIVSFRKDRKSMAACVNEGVHFMETGSSVWHDFAKWYKEKK